MSSLLSDQDSSVITASRVYSKIGSLIAEEYGVPLNRSAPRPLAQALMSQVRQAVRLSGERVAEETATRAYRHVDETLAEHFPDGLFIPATSIMINSIDLGQVRIREFNSHRSGQ